MTTAAWCFWEWIGVNLFAIICDRIRCKNLNRWQHNIHSFPSLRVLVDNMHAFKSLKCSMMIAIQFLEVAPSLLNITRCVASGYDWCFLRIVTNSLNGHYLNNASFFQYRAKEEKNALFKGLLLFYLTLFSGNNNGSLLKLWYSFRKYMIWKFIVGSGGFWLLAYGLYIQNNKSSSFIIGITLICLGRIYIYWNHFYNTHVIIVSNTLYTLIIFFYCKTNS